MNKRINKTILIVEDEKYLRDLYVKILVDDGFAVESAPDGYEGLNMILQNSYDLILLDIILPNIDGIQILDRVHAEQKEKLGSIVLLTNLSKNDVISNAVEKGIRGYLIKNDYTPDELIQEVKNLLNI